MEVFAHALIAAGLVSFITGYLSGVVIAFRDSPALGAACLLVPAILFFHLSTRLSRGRLPLLAMSFGMGLTVLGMAVEFEAGRERIHDR